MLRDLSFSYRQFFVEFEERGVFYNLSRRLCNNKLKRKQLHQVTLVCMKSQWFQYNSQVFAHCFPRNMIVVTGTQSEERGGGYGDVYSVSRFIYTRTVADPNPGPGAIRPTLVRASPCFTFCLSPRVVLRQRWLCLAFLIAIVQTCAEHSIKLKHSFEQKSQLSLKICYFLAFSLPNKHCSLLWI